MAEIRTLEACDQRFLPRDCLEHRLPRGHQKKRESSDIGTILEKLDPQKDPYAARRVVAPPIARAMSLFVAPMARSERTRRSILTVASPASIFATRDWLEPRSRATAAWESLRLARCVLKRSASANFISTN